MINALLATYLVDALSDLNGTAISRLSGLVKVLETDAFTSGKVSRFPIPVNSTQVDCARSGRAFPDLMPNDSEGLIVYFEDGGAVSNNGKWISRLRLVGWGNSEAFINVSFELLPVVLVARITRLLKHISVPIDSPVSSLRCEVVGSPSADANLFSKYTYSETRSQYLLAPYFAFGIDLQLTYILNDNCNFELAVRTVSEC